MPAIKLCFPLLLCALLLSAYFSTPTQATAAAEAEAEAFQDQKDKLLPTYDNIPGYQGDAAAGGGAPPLGFGAGGQFGAGAGGRFGGVGAGFGGGAGGWLGGGP
ncbi:glycine-rich protein 5-like [Diospyros lotus]|uniref:glycine-rich protein 5-like n=1 Tax=Diospyros lotus TaxID=55363 RepID=UPI002259F43F|nr:glycine-rich protein 5-like [Diospyros lotus]